MPIQPLIAERRIIAVDADRLLLESSIEAEPGDIFYVGDEVVSLDELDGESNSRAFAGLPGTSFARVLVDKEGNRHVPHYKAVDLASDNRILPGAYQQTQLTFEPPPECSSGDVRARLIYRPLSLEESRLRGWESRDYSMFLAAQEW